MPSAFPPSRSGTNYDSHKDSALNFMRNLMNTSKNGGLNLKLIRIVSLLAIAFVLVFSGMNWFSYEIQEEEFNSNSYPPIKPRSISSETIPNFKRMKTISLNEISSVVPNNFTVAVFLGLNKNQARLKDLTPCIQNIVRAKGLFHLATGSTNNLVIDVYISYSQSPEGGEERGITYELISDSMKPFIHDIDHLYIQELLDNNISPFLWQATKAFRAKRNYDAAIRLHTQSQSTFLEHSSNCLCGSPEQVSSILRQFFYDEKLALVGPAGFTLSSKTTPTNVAPILAGSISSILEKNSYIFDNQTIEGVQKLYSLVYPKDTDLKLKEDDLVVVAGSVSWFRYSYMYASDIIAAIQQVRVTLYTRSGKSSNKDYLYHIFFSTLMKLRGGKVKEILPAPKPIASYYSQAIDLSFSDRIKDDGFVDWATLKGVSHPELKLPLSEEKGGLGYYNLTSRETRAAQAKLAKKYGIYGFMYHHYWFTEKEGLPFQKCMNRIPELMLLDEEPNIPFLLSWVNAPITQITGEKQMKKATTVGASYGSQQDWADHFQYLLPYFRHPNYIKLEGMPAFIIQRAGHMNDSLSPMLSLWNNMAVKYGMKGISFVNSLGYNYISDKSYKAVKASGNVFRASLHSWPGLSQIYSGGLASKYSVPLRVASLSVQIWGAMAGLQTHASASKDFDLNPTPDEFHSALQSSFKAMKSREFSLGRDNLYSIHSWNSWNDQSGLEPSDTHGFYMLEALQDSLINFPSIYPETIYNSKALEESPDTKTGVIAQQLSQGVNDTTVYRVAVFVHIGINPTLKKVDFSKISEIAHCIKNIAEAKKYFVGSAQSRATLAIDVYLSITNTHEYEKVQKAFKNLIKPFKSQINSLFLRKQEVNEGLDILPFLLQLKDSVSARREYDVALKLHSKSDGKWMNHALQCLCGTPMHVSSILTQMYESRFLSLMSPIGMAFGPHSSVHSIAHLLRHKYKHFEKELSLSSAFSLNVVQDMQRIFSIVEPSSPSLADSVSLSDGLLVIAGTMFWVKYNELNPENIIKTIREFKFTKGYADNERIEHAFERYFPTSMRLRGREIREISPAPKPIAIYFPQFHQFPENDRFWGEGFTEWTLLKKASYPQLKLPLSEEKGGLGYYNLTSRAIRAKQAQIAKQYGVQGFMFYHYWFSGKQAPKHHKVMYKIPELMLLDGEPDIPFFFSWANEPWNRRWGGETDGEVLLSQTYGDAKEWEEHFQYLLPFFKHKNYIKIHQKPAFAIYRVGHVNQTLIPMLTLWNKLAVKNGFQGIHFINTLSTFYRSENTNELVAKAGNLFSSSLHFWPAIRAIRESGNLSSSRSSLKDISVPSNVQFWGANTGFDPSPRKAVPEHYRINLTPKEFKSEVTQSFSSMKSSDFSYGVDNLYFITAWNEWNEQAVLEPTDKYEFHMLESLRDCLLSFPATRVSYGFPKELN